MKVGDRLGLNDRYFVFRESTGELIFTTDSREQLYNRFYNLTIDLSNDYIIYDNILNDYFYLYEV